MTVRTTLPLIALTTALQPAHVSAQNTISYETGEYEYAQALPELDDDVVTETIEAAAADQPVGAARSIPARAETPVFVRSPTIQPIERRRIRGSCARPRPSSARGWGPGTA